ncbi:26 kDa repressor protein [Xenorhabdus bovienii str. puntauvense]|uniref:26 kDa repressor protein n=2 Tax=Xenorhabdus bovienii TaxID=40576 RepID=A0A077NC50_XENBV|nr:helix-turn-helix transcriptional regulator [Xenorhabdus bovienii]CDG95853.1 26 kDa repressor protein [Xenorhabdus bovienii str. puntauvense]CDH26741.1 26 kDa repressor protein [Xenorhabdus bovienii str. kraussei Becker Underwood]
MKTTLAERLKKARKQAGLSQKALGECVGVTQASIQKLEGGRASSSTKLIDIAKTLGVSPEWLSGTGEDSRATLGSRASSSIENEIKRDSQYYKVEVFDVQASAGKGVIVRDEFIETIFSIEYTSGEAKSLFGGRPANHIKMIAVNGDSMSGTFETKDQIFVDISVNYFDGDGIYIFVLGNQLYIKRLQLQYKKMAIISDNKKYETWYLDENEVSEIFIQGKVLVSQSHAYKFHG